jgi:hypothetical protein
MMAVFATPGTRVNDAKAGVDKTVGITDIPIERPLRTPKDEERPERFRQPEPHRRNPKPQRGEQQNRSPAVDVGEPRELDHGEAFRKEECRLLGCRMSILMIDV